MSILSVVLPAYNEEQMVGKTCRVLHEVLSGAGISYELVLVNDGSKDNTWNEIFEPRKTSTKAEQVFNLVDNSIAIYDGAMLGYKIIHRLRDFFRRKKDH